MKNHIVKTSVTLAIGLLTATSAVRADSFFTDVRDGSERIARETWDGTKAVTRTIVHSPGLAYDAIRGRPHDTVMREHRDGESVALTGHRTGTKTQSPEMNTAVMTDHDKSQM